MNKRISILLAFTAISLSTACSTVTPSVLVSDEPSFDQGGQNSGVIKQVEEGIVVTPGLRDRFNALVLIYGRDYTPALTQDQGVSAYSEKLFIFQRKTFIKFLEMNAWRKSGFNPINK